MSEDNTIQVNFGKPIPVFPLDHVTLLPQQVLPLHIFEPRYRQMVEHALDGAGQIAMAIFRSDDWKQQYHAKPPVRPAVCIGQIVQHEKLPDGRYNIALQGVCRAKILRELPADEGRLYRLAYLEPVGLGLPHNAELESVEGETPASLAEDVSPSLGQARRRLGELLSEGPLMKFRAAKPVLEYVLDESIPTVAVLELISFTMINDSKLKYSLLEEPHAELRAEIILRELEHLSKLIAKAQAQHPESWPKGCSWN